MMQELRMKAKILSQVLVVYELFVGSLMLDFGRASLIFIFVSMYLFYSVLLTRLIM